VFVWRNASEIAAPDHYKLTFSPDFNKNDFAGDETIEVRVLKPTGCGSTPAAPAATRGIRDFAARLTTRVERLRLGCYNQACSKRSQRFDCR